MENPTPQNPQRNRWVLVEKSFYSFDKIKEWVILDKRVEDKIMDNFYDSSNIYDWRSYERIYKHNLHKKDYNQYVYFINDIYIYEYNINYESHFRLYNEFTPKCLYYHYANIKQFFKNLNNQFRFFCVEVINHPNVLNKTLKGDDYVEMMESDTADTIELFEAKCILGNRLFFGILQKYRHL